MVAITAFLNMDINYPGIGIKPELSMLRDYLGIMEISIERVGSEYIAKEEEKNRGADQDEYRYCYLIAEEEIPRVIRNPAFVSIYSLLESSISALLKYAQEKENKTLSFREVGRGSLLSRANKYMKNILNYEFEFKNIQLEKVADIYKVRNFIVHSNGSLDDMTNDVDKPLMKCDEKFYITSTYFGRAGVTSEYLIDSFDFVESSIRDLMSYMEQKYFETGT
ncbi:hypothetical protein [Parahaliea aestuarii]|uniref:MAE-28990/MAE-18760-like HEPN domain-containing protein n=1 Tax=Parahaliea aestuarii TaxID=1852021 RepID=A0A5C8ZPY1_9GAMM|nr:hypothetical protein [Parahaliea aestuarii]TXS89732.1 hypothetical protein FVW59_17155 [Parahaliea aestuarii]